jgi:HK97 family phage portal protein
MEAAQYSIDQHNECIKWNKSLLENGARPCGALVVKQTMSDETYERLKSEMDDKIKGGDNSGKYLILEGGIEWKEMSINPRDMDFIETKNSSARDIAIAFGVPSQMLGIKGDATYNNMSEARLSFWEETVLPICKMILGELSEWLSKSYNRNLIIEPDLDTISAISEKRQKIWETVNKSDFVSENEKRESLGGNYVFTSYFS